MSQRYSAEVFNQSEAYFMRASELVEGGDTGSMEQMKYFLMGQAPGLNNYIGRYIRDVVTPFTADTETGEIDRYGSLWITAFNVGAFMTFKMIDGVYRETGAELPYMGADDFEPVNPYDLEFEADGTKAVIDLFYRGTELREKMPHVFHASLGLMKKVVELPVEDLEKDLSTPLLHHHDPRIAFSELYFIGGSAEIALTIEERAAQEAATS